MCWCLPPSPNARSLLISWTDISYSPPPIYPQVAGSLLITNINTSKYTFIFTGVTNIARDFVGKQPKHCTRSMGLGYPRSVTTIMAVVCVDSKSYIDKCINSCADRQQFNGQLAGFCENMTWRRRGSPSTKTSYQLTFTLRDTQGQRGSLIVSIFSYRQVGVYYVLMYAKQLWTAGWLS